MRDIAGEPATKWERIGARDGGTVTGLISLRGVEGDALVFAATATGIHRSDDGGHHWVPSGTAVAVPFATAVAATPEFAADGTLFATARGGVYRSRDWGRVWERVLTGGLIFAVAVSPAFAQDRMVFVATAEDGVLRSTDGGTTWSGANAGLLDFTVLTLALSPGFADDRTAFAGTASGLYRSRNGGRSWREVDIGLDEAGVQALSVSPDFARDRIVLAGTETDGLLHSADAGATWQAVEALVGRSVTAVAMADGKNGSLLLAAATEDVVLLSQDGGKQWWPSPALPAPAVTLAFVPRAPDGAGNSQPSLLVGLHGRGVARLAGGGRLWEATNDGLSATPLTMLAPSPDFAHDKTLFAASSDGVVLSTRDGGANWSEWDVVLDEPAILGLTISPRFVGDRTIWVAAADGLYRSRDGGESWQLLPMALAPTAGASDRVRADNGGSAPLAALAVAATDGGQRPILFAVGPAAELFRSEDSGDTWRSLGPVAAGVNLISIALSPAFASDRTVFAVASGAAGPEGEPGLVLWRSADGGIHWDRWLDVRGAALLPLAIPPSHCRDGIMFVGAGRQVLKGIPNTRGGFSRPFWRATDLSPEVAAIVALATPVHNVVGQTVFAATNAGVYVSRDGGQSYAPWSDGLDRPSVVTLAISPDYDSDALVFAVSLGGAVWRRRDG